MTLGGSYPARGYPPGRTERHRALIDGGAALAGPTHGPQDGVLSVPGAGSLLSPAGCRLILCNKSCRSA